MVKISIDYLGELRCAAVHLPSGRQLQTDAPIDNHGRGESFSPTDLVATALGACMATIMGIFSQRHQINLEGMKIEVTKEMSKDTPRRIAKLTTEFWIPVALSPENREKLEKAALACPVHHSLHPDVEKPVIFHWNEKKS